MAGNYLSCVLQDEVREREMRRGTEGPGIEIVHIEKH
jgi:hypothetical protein